MHSFRALTPIEGMTNSMKKNTIGDKKKLGYSIPSTQEPPQIGAESTCSKKVRILEQSSTAVAWLEEHTIPGRANRSDD